MLPPLLPVASIDTKTHSADNKLEETLCFFSLISRMNRLSNVLLVGLKWAEPNRERGVTCGLGSVDGCRTAGW